jgi:predicted secreted protein
VAALDGGGHWSGKFMFTSLEIVGTNGELTTVSISLESSGAITWTDAV